MKCNFEFKPVEQTFSDPVAAVFKPGTPFGREYSRGDIVLLHPEISTSKVYLNSLVLRDAILGSKEYLEKKLGIIITDAKEEPKKAPAKKTKGKPKEDLETTIEEPVKEEHTDDPVDDSVSDLIIEDVVVPDIEE